ncbi:MAG: hypothetical protein KAR54_03085 [Candidatus Pacebacteria bacterium]|nr:hypothetical protein [Candidatus Paceibacterota bacterium]
MKKIFKIFIAVIFLSVAIVLVILFFNKGGDIVEPYNQEENNIITKPGNQEEIRKNDDAISVFVQSDEKRDSLGKGALKNKEIVLIKSKTLQPEFIVTKNKAIQDMRIYFDESEEDLLSSRFSNAEKNKNDEKGVEFKFPYTLNPESHSLKIDYIFEGEEISEEYNFILVFYDDFSVSLEESKFWGMTKEAKTCYNNWKIENGKLKTNKLVLSEDEDCQKSSLFFIRKLKGDFFVQYDLISKSETVVLNSYLLERKLNFFFGDGTNKDVIIKTSAVLARNNYIFEQDKSYQVRITRTQNVYKVFVSDTEKISDDNLLISYIDNGHTSRPFDSSGFTVYGNSGDMEIDNFYSSNEDINSIFNFDEEE